MISPRLLSKAMLIAVGITAVLVAVLSVVFGSLQAFGDRLGVSGEGLVVLVTLGALLVAWVWPERGSTKVESEGSRGGDRREGQGPDSA